MINKTTSIENLEKIILKLKKKGKKIVLCHGVFDLLHIGHIKHFNEAKNYGDILVVTLTPDIYVNKGPKRPAFNEELRVEAIAALNVVDFVALNSSPTAINVIEKIKPNIFCKGSDYKNHKNDISGQIKNEINAVKKIKKNYTFLKIRKLIENFKKMKVLVIGEAIIDQYVFCEVLGKSGKEPLLILRNIKTEEYLGGAIAISRHLSPFSNHISLLSMVGEKGEYLKEIKNNLPKNVNFEYIRKKNSPTILKRRFLDNVSNNKVFGVYTINDDILEKKEEKLFYNKLKKLIPKHDLVIVSDYGHGLISNKSANLISKLSKYLALNAQINAANVGYHSMRNYKTVDCVIINEKEIRHELRDKNGIINSLIKRLSQEQNIKNLVVTRGVSGSTLYNKKDNKFIICDAYAKTAIDKIGAGDAMLSIVALCLKCGFHRDLALLIGSLAAAQSVKSMGNKEAINKNKILKSLESILK
jgi:rfaE bifunctional protein kinase chain/domain/rfaE bifunctional protein nucleotidyltransferase chain/domain